MNFLINNFQLELCENNLTGEDLEKLVQLCPKLYKIKLDNNKIESLDSIKKLKGLSLEKISVKGNPFVNNNNYKDEIFIFFPELIAIDGKNNKGEEIESTEYGDEMEGEEIEDNEEELEEEEFDDDESEEYNEEEDDIDDDDEEENEKSHKKHKH